MKSLPQKEIMEEGIATEFYTKLKESKNPAHDLSMFYCSLFETGFTSDIAKSVARAVKLFGRDSVYWAIVSIEGMDVNHTNIYPLLRFMCLKRLEGDTSQKPVDLSDYRDNMQKLSEKALHTRWKIRSPFDDK